MVTFTNSSADDFMDWREKHQANGYVLTQHGSSFMIHSRPLCNHLGPWKTVDHRHMKDPWRCSTDRSELEREATNPPDDCPDCERMKAREQQTASW